VSSSPAVVNATVGSFVLLTCEGLGGPNNSVSWMRQGVQIASTETLNVTIDSAIDGGEYVCVISNAAGFENSTSEINGELMVKIIVLYYYNNNDCNVNLSNFFLAVIPLITTNPSSQNVSLNENITLSCEAVGFPTPSILWFHNDSEAIDPQANSDQVISTGAVSSNLTIATAMVNDSGNYFCQASSIAGVSISEVARVLVQSKFTKHY